MNMSPEAERLIAELQLIEHPEGGFFRETYRSTTSLLTEGGSRRSALTNIYFLLTAGTFSAWHRIDADETWHFYRGTGVVVSVIDEDSDLQEHTLGPEGPWQLTVAAGCYFAAYVPDANGYALLGCSVAPGFEFSGFEIPSRETLTARHPKHTAAITRFTR